MCGWTTHVSADDKELRVILEPIRDRLLKLQAMADASMPPQHHNSELKPAYYVTRLYTFTLTLTSEREEDYSRTEGKKPMDIRTTAYEFKINHATKESATHSQVSSCKIFTARYRQRCLRKSPEKGHWKGAADRAKFNWHGH